MAFSDLSHRAIITLSADTCRVLGWQANDRNRSGSVVQIEGSPCQEVVAANPPGGSTLPSGFSGSVLVNYSENDRIKAILEEDKRMQRDRKSRGVARTPQGIRAEVANMQHLIFIHKGDD